MSARPPQSPTQPDRQWSPAEASDATECLARAFEAAAVPLWVEDEDGRVMLANRAYRQLVDAPPAPSALMRDEIGTAGDTWRDGREPSPPVVGSFDGRRCHVTRTALRDADRRLVGRVCAAVEVDTGSPGDRSPAPAANGAAALPAHADAARDAFVAIAAHELRSPLNALRGWAHLLMHASAPSADLIQRAAAAIERNVESQSQLIDELLAVWRRLDAEAQPRLRDIDLVDALRTAADEARSRLRMRTAAVCLDDAVRPLLVVSDPKQLHEVLVQVLSAALACTPQDGAIDVAARSAGRQARLTVRGAAPQSTATPVRPGIGYALARHMIEASGGRLSAERGAEGPTTYVLELPLAPSPRDRSRSG